MQPEERLIVALDQRTEQERLALVDQLGDLVGFYKVNHQWLFERGLGWVTTEMIERRGKKLFLDLKLWDVPTVVAGYIRKMAPLGVSFTTVHGTGEIIRQAVESTTGTHLRILAVTVLTSWTRQDVKELWGIDEPVDETVIKMARYLLGKGCHGVISSPLEIARLRAELQIGAWGVPLIVTPGIRAEAAAQDDHQRLATPRSAVAAGADHIVVGRPIYAADDPLAAAEKYVAGIRRGIEDRMISARPDGAAAPEIRPSSGAGNPD